MFFFHCVLNNDVSSSCWVFDLFDYDFDREQDDDYNDYDVILGFDRELRE